MNPLSQRSLLLHLHIRKWAAEVTDKSALQIVAVAKNADTQHDKYKKSLFVADVLKEVDRCAGRLRSFFYHETLPWSDGGGRLIPSRHFRQFSIRFKELAREFEMAVAEFLHNYDEHKQEAKEKKGELYIESEYPHVLEVHQKFGVELSTLPFPQVGADFRVEAPEEVIEELKHDMQESLQKVNGRVNQEVLSLIRMRLATIHTSLSSGKGFKRTIFEELEHAVSFAHGLGDVLTPETLKLVTDIEQYIFVATPESIRNSQKLKADIVHNIQEMLAHVRTS